MNNDLSTKKIVLLVLSVFIIVGAVFYISGHSSKINSPTNLATVRGEDVAALLPLGLPLEITAGSVAKISKNNDNQIVTYSYSSIKSIKDILVSFVEFFEKNKAWGDFIVNDKTKIKTVSATNLNTKNSITVTVTQGKNLETNDIFVSYIENLSGVSSADLFKDFPTEIGFDVSANDTQSRDSNGNMVLTRNYTSRIPANDNYERYSKLLISNGWHIGTGKYDTASSKNILALKTNARIGINISTLETNPQIIITLTLLK